MNTYTNLVSDLLLARVPGLDKIAACRRGPRKRAASDQCVSTVPQPGVSKSARRKCAEAVMDPELDKDAAGCKRAAGCGQRKCASDYAEALARVLRASRG